jgi:peroxin-5
LVSAQRDELEHDYSADMQQLWEGGLGDYQDISQDEGLLKFDDDGLPILGEYKFGTCQEVCFVLFMQYIYDS